MIALIKIEDWHGKVLFEKKPAKDAEGVRVLDPEPAFIISHILYDNNARSAAFGGGSYLNVSGHPEGSLKTRTTNNPPPHNTGGLFWPGMAFLVRVVVALLCFI